MLRFWAMLDYIGVHWSTLEYTGLYARVSFNVRESVIIDVLPSKRPILPVVSKRDGGLRCQHLVEQHGSGGEGVYIHQKEG